MLLGEAARVEEVRRKAGVRGDVLPSVLCKEPDDVRLCNVGVVDRAFPPSEPELGALRSRGFLEWSGPGVVLRTSDGM